MGTKNSMSFGNPFAHGVECITIMIVLKSGSDDVFGSKWSPGPDQFFVKTKIDFMRNPRIAIVMKSWDTSPIISCLGNKTNLNPGLLWANTIFNAEGIIHASRPNNESLIKCTSDQDNEDRNSRIPHEIDFGLEPLKRSWVVFRMSILVSRIGITRLNLASKTP